MLRSGPQCDFFEKNRPPWFTFGLAGQCVNQISAMHCFWFGQRLRPTHRQTHKLMPASQEFNLFIAFEFKIYFNHLGTTYCCLAALNKLTIF